jgi:3-oxoacyl-[acyl-carrier-protein] synthase I
MRVPIYIVSDNIISPLGMTTAANFKLLSGGLSGIGLHTDPAISDQPFYASLLPKKETFLSGPAPSTYTKFEELLIASMEDALQKTSVDIRDKKTVLIISSTKGNISLLETAAFNPASAGRLTLHDSAKRIAAHFQHPNKPIIVSNACISGLLALLTAFRLIQSGQYEHAVVSGCDIITRFIFSGFQSFQAISELPCKPFDAERKGISLGEGAATLVLSIHKNPGKIPVRLAGGAVSNDANHISGPSRTGEELFIAIRQALADAGLSASDIDFISTHGTATVYNDEMEANAISLAGMETIPANSLKGNFGHTLGAAGLIESIVSVQSLKENIVLPTKGFNKSGVTKSINICSTLQPLVSQNCLKTASGFGGCNAALVFSK